LTSLRSLPLFIGSRSEGFLSTSVFAILAWQHPDGSWRDVIRFPSHIIQNAGSLIGKKTTAGCISLLNIDIIHLYDRVELGTRAVILPPDA
jgi:hypothetical protein